MYIYIHAGTNTLLLTYFKLVKNEADFTCKNQLNFISSKLAQYCEAKNQKPPPP